MPGQPCCLLRPLALFILVLLVSSCRTVDKHDANDLKVIGGTPTHAYPQVGLILQKGGPYCSGTLIGARKVVTAAHCLVQTSPDSLQFVMENEQGTDKTTIPVASVKLHPAYDQAASLYDIGIIELLTDTPYPPMPVEIQDQASPWLNQNLLTVGYGRNVSPATTGSKDSGSGIKRSAELTVTAINASKIRLETAGKSACNGDSGGAILRVDDAGRASLVGVISCGDPSCLSFGVATRVDAFTQFLSLSTKRSDQKIKPACGAPFNRGVCEQNQIKFCDNDCYEAKLQTEICSGSSRCRIDPILNKAVCYEPSQWQHVELTFKKLVIRNGTYSDGPELSQLYLFFDRESNAQPPRLNEPHFEVPASGVAALDLEIGTHEIEALQLQGSHGVTLVPRFTLTVERNIEAKTVVLPVENVRIEVKTDAGWGQAVYLTGQGHLLGDWREAIRLNYDSKNKLWVYEGTLARDLEFKLLKAPWSNEPRITLTPNNFVWEAIAGNHKVAEGNIPYNGAFRHSIEARF